MKVDINKLRCKRCGHEWTPRQEVVRICPRCKSPYWDKKRKIKEEKQDENKHRTVQHNFERSSRAL